MREGQVIRMAFIKEGICSSSVFFSCFLKMMLGGEHVQLLDENDRVPKGRS